MSLLTDTSGQATPAAVSVVIPTYCRGPYLVDTIRMLLELSTRPAEILVLDQTERHSVEVSAQLEAWHLSGTIVWRHLNRPAIVPAMNVGLHLARNNLVLFLDDDIIPGPDLITAHLDAMRDPRYWASVGQVLQPGEEPLAIPAAWTLKGFRAGLDFPFRSALPAEPQNVMAGNLCVNRARAASIGGFDEAFAGSAYRFESDFARRIIEAGGRIRFEPKASIRHLRAPSGGTRQLGSHLCSASPLHGMGDYYFAMKRGMSLSALWHIVRRPVREVATRHHLRHPHCIPIKLWGELRAIAMAWRAYRRFRK